MLLIISDGLKGIVDAFGEVYPKAKYQTCCVHLSQNIAHKVRVSDRAEIVEILNPYTEQLMNKLAKQL